MVDSAGSRRDRPHSQHYKSGRLKQMLAHFRVFKQDLCDSSHEQNEKIRTHVANLIRKVISLQGDRKSS